MTANPPSIGTWTASNAVGPSWNGAITTTHHLAPEADNVFEEIAAGYEEAAKRLRAAKKRATAERKKREKSTANAQGHKRGRTTLDEALSIPSQERAHDAKEDAAAG
ncbi:hypothetical protein [Streptomyces goshikiensis]|uniref:hypothetical protein n=1 Tax=Streptomyces goshikiensis TaxID=1942 RepID=UPI003659F19B